MPLSEYEQRVLEEMEQQLRSDDPKFAGALQAGPRKPLFLLLGILGVMAGLGLLVAGVATGHIWLGIIGFVAMFAGVLAMLQRGEVAGDAGGRPAPARSESAAAPKKTPKKSGFMDRLEERWDDRNREG